MEEPFGEDIDSHDMVFRFNSATTKGFEKHVGAKTTHRIANSRNYGFREYDGEAVVQHMRNEASLSKLFRKRRKHPDLNLYGIHPALHAWVDKSFSFLVTSGLFGILIAAHRCHEIDLYGGGPSASAHPFGPLVHSQVHSMVHWSNHRSTYCPLPARQASNSPR